MSGFISVVNFERFQHYTDRRPPWIKLHCALLDDDRFFDLADVERYHLIGLFILASQHDNKIPNKPEWLKHQLRTTKAISLERLIETGWIAMSGQDASTPLAERLHDASPRARAERREEKSRDSGNYTPEFEEFWKAYPRKKGKGEAFNEWNKNGHPPVERVIEILKIASACFDWTKDNGRFIPHPSTWLHQKRWDDDYGPAKTKRGYQG